MSELAVDSSVSATEEGVGDKEKWGGGWTSAEVTNSVYPSGDLERFGDRSRGRTDLDLGEGERGRRRSGLSKKLDKYCINNCLTCSGC